MFKSFKQPNVFLIIQSSYYSFSKGPLTPIKSDRQSSDFSQASVNLTPLPTWYYFPHVWWLWKQVIKLIGLFNFHSYLSCHHKFQPSEDGKMLVLLYLEEIFIFTTSALLNPAADFLGKMVWFTLTAISITTPNLCYLHLGLWTGHIPSIKSLWWFNRETVNIIYLGLKTSVVKKIQREPNVATQFLSWSTEFFLSNIHYREHIKTVLCLLCWLLTAYCSRFIMSLLICKMPSSLSPGYVRDHITFQEQVLLSSALPWLNGNSTKGCWSRAEELRVWWGQCKSHQLLQIYEFSFLRQGVVIVCLCGLSPPQLQTETF